MLSFSSKTLINREYKLSDFLKQINATKEVREDAKKVKAIYFQNVINSQTLNCLENKKYQNIYVIRMELNTDIIPKMFMEALDKNIAFHTYFIFEYSGEISTWVTYKEIGKKIILDNKYYYHDFHVDEPVELPNLDDVPDAYVAILSYEIGRPARHIETPDDYIKRMHKMNKLEFQISKTEAAIIYETQPKKKFEYNSRLRKYREEYKDLSRMEE